MYDYPAAIRSSEKLQRVFNEPATAPVYIVCEIGINHNGSVERALALIDAAADAGVDAVKFQKRSLPDIYAPGVLQDANNSEWNFEYLMPLLRECELSEDDYRTISAHCHDRHLDLVVTPFDEVSLAFIATLDLAAVKIASADMTNLGLVRASAKLGLPLLISTGMWPAEDISRCAAIYQKEGLTFALLHTQSNYPAPYESINLGFINTLRTMADVVGYSGHERGTFIPVAAVALGCRIIEKHITFDRNDKGPDHKASMLPDEWSRMVSEIRLLEKSLGDGKTVNQAEIQNRELFAKSAVAVRPLKKGHILLPEDVMFRSPGKGIFPHEIDEYYKLALLKDVEQNHYIAAADFEKELCIVDWKPFSFQRRWGVKCRFHDFEEYAVLKTPVIEFHCSQSDLDIPFNGRSDVSELIIHAPEIFNRELVDICSSDPGKVDRSLSVIQRSIDKAIAIGRKFPRRKPRLVVHLGGMFLDPQDHVDTAELTERAVMNFRRLEFSPDEIEILPENLPPRPWYLGGEWHQHGFMTAEDMIAFCTACGLGMTFDMCHAYLYCSQYGLDLNAYTRQVRHIARHLHISDATGINGEGLQIGDGDIEFPSFIEALGDADFTWVPEVWSAHLHHGAGIYRALQLLEKFGGGL